LLRRYPHALVEQRARRRSFGIGSRDPVEAGDTAHVGGMIVFGSSHTWVGWSVTAGPDVHVWMSDDIGVQLSGEATMGAGYTSKDGPENAYFNDAMFLVLGGSVGLLWRL
jgi:hypothetical protein